MSVNCRKQYLVGEKMYDSVRALFLSGLQCVCLLLFVAYNGTLYAQTPRLLKDINPLVLPPQRSMCGQPVNVSDLVYFCGTTGVLWRSDGTSAGTQIVRYRDGRAIKYFRDAVVIGNRLYFNAESIDWQFDHHLWVVDTANPDLALPVVDANGEEIEDPELMTEVSGELFYFRRSFNGTSEQALW